MGRTLQLHWPVACLPVLDLSLKKSVVRTQRFESPLIRKFFAFFVTPLTQLLQCSALPSMLVAMVCIYDHKSALGNQIEIFFWLSISICWCWLSRHGANPLYKGVRWHVNHKILTNFSAVAAGATFKI